MSDVHDTLLRDAVSILSAVGRKNGLQIDVELARSDISRAIENYRARKRDQALTIKGKPRATALNLARNKIQKLIGAYEQILSQPGLIDPLVCVFHHHPDYGYLIEPEEYVREVIALLNVQEDWLVGSSRVDLQACKLEYSIVSPK